MKNYIGIVVRLCLFNHCFPAIEWTGSDPIEHYRQLQRTREFSVKEASSNRVNVQPMPYHRKPAPRKRSYRLYQQQKLRQQRICLVGLGLLFLIGVVVAGVWGGLRFGPPMIQAITSRLTTPNLSQPITPSLPQSWFAQAGPESTSDLEHVLAEDFHLMQSPSLLYSNTANTLHLARATSRPLSSTGRLMPMMTVQEDSHLRNQLEALFAQFPSDRFIPHLYFYNLQDGTYVEINGYSPVPAASVIKLPILIDYLVHLDERDIAMDTPLLYADFHRAGGAGELQYKPAGVEFAANDVAGQMIRISDNTCTNMMISYLGGMDAVNRRLEQMGLVQTRIRNVLPDLTGTNTISPYEMATMLYNLEQGKLVSQASQMNGIDILKSTHNRRLLVWPLPKEAVVAHKTGDIGTALGDSGIIYMPDGRKYIMSMQVERPFNDYTARDMVQKASRLVYDYLSEQSYMARQPEHAATLPAGERI